MFGLIFGTGWRGSTQGTNFVTLVFKVVQSVIAVTYILFRYYTLQVGNYIIVPKVLIIYEVQFLAESEF